jgi:anaerobic C4-dicarboxylate transporter
MKTNEALKLKWTAFPAIFVLFALMFISSFHLEKKWDGIACGTVCVIGIVAFLFSLRNNPDQRKARLVVVIPAVLLGAAAVIAIWLIRGHWY